MFRSCVATLVLVAVLAVLPVGGPSGHERAAASQARIVFVNDTDGYDQRGTDLWTVHPDGSGLTRLTDDVEEERRPRWSPDGTEYAYAVYHPDTHAWAVRIASVDGSDVRNVVEMVADHVRWSPDGQWLAFEHPVGGYCNEGSACDPREGHENALYVVRRDGSDLHQVTDGYAPEWAPDSERLVFKIPDEKPDGSAGTSVAVVRRDGSGLTQLTDTGTDDIARWSPDGSTIAFNRVIDDGDSRTTDLNAYLMDPDGSDQRPVWDDPSVRSSGVGVWAPDSSRLTISARTDEQGGIFAIAPDGTGATLLVSTDPDRGVHGLSWAPDSHTVVFSRVTWDVNGQIMGDLYLATADGGGPHRITDLGTAFHPHYQPTGAPPASTGLSTRIAGPDRIATSIAVAKDVFEDATTVFVARADAYPDALATAPLASRRKAPIYLTGPDRLDPRVGEDLARYQEGFLEAIVLGGEQAISPRVADELREAGVDEVTRIGGRTRYVTAADIARQIGEPPNQAAFLALGGHPEPKRGWADAVAVSTLAATLGQPILLTEHDQLPDATRQVLDDVRISTVTIVGGTAAVSDQVADAIRKTGRTVRRIAGATRYETSRLIADRTVDAGMRADRTWLATGTNWPDSLSAGSAVVHDSGVLLLVHGDDLAASPPAIDWLDTHGGTFDRLVVLGGTAAISQAVQDGIDDHASD